MSRIVIVGCGIVGAAIAYELSAIADLDITVLDRQPPAQESTGAALGVLMGAISQKKKGRAWTLRELSLRQYETWVPELEAVSGQDIPYNRQGIVKLTFEGDDLERWKTLQTVRQEQGWPLDIWTASDLHERCPLVGERLGDRPITGAVYSSRDRQLDPTALTQALVTASQKRGVTFDFEANVCDFDLPSSPSTSSPHTVHTATQIHPADWVVIAAGLGADGLTKSLHRPVDIRPVLGQAIRMRSPLSPSPSFAPVITGNDIHIIPLPNGDYWVGATVEFPDDMGCVTADSQLLQTVLDGAMELYPTLAQSTIIQQWSGRRPRPFGRPAPIVEPLSDHPGIIVAAGHYRNGVLLAPATADLVRQMIMDT